MANNSPLEDAFVNSPFNQNETSTESEITGNMNSPFGTESMFSETTKEEFQLEKKFGRPHRNSITDKP